MTTVRLDEMLEQSRLAASISQRERGEMVDWARVAELQSLDLARANELYAIDAIQREREADEEFERELRGD